MKRTTLLVVSLLFAFETNACTITGTVDVAVEGKWAATAMVVSLYKLNGTNSLSDETLLGGLQPSRIARVTSTRDCTVGAVSRVCFDFAFENCAAETNFAVVAASDPLGDSRPHPELYAPFGYYRFGASWGYGSVRCNSNNAEIIADFSADSATPWPAVPALQSHGKLWNEGSVHVLHTWGTARERGVAHGTLLAAQIVDFFRFFVLQRGGAESASQYETLLLPFLRTSMRIPLAMQDEVDGIMEGARASGVPLFVPELSRDLSSWDVVAINAYLELCVPASTRFGCSQVSFWGSWTAGANGVTAARNMDGEIDPRKVTALYTLVHAMEPTDGGRRVVSVMWPGFVGTLSGMSEDGRYLMMDSSSLAQNKTRVNGATVLTWTLIEALRTMPAEAAKTPEATKKWLVTNHGTSGGGLALAGSLLFFASNTTPPFVFENNRFGGVIRQADAVAPFEPDCIAISNHFLAYGADLTSPSTTNFGQPVSFSSLWRYETWRNKIGAWRETGKVVTQNDMKELLKDTCHGTTEHAVIWTPSFISVAVAKPTFSPWNAPHGAWVMMTFEQLFSK